MKALAKALGWLAERRSRLRGGQPIPGDEHQRFSIPLAKRRQSSQHRPVPPVLTRATEAIVDSVALGFEQQSLAPRCCSPLRPGNVARDGQQPRQRSVWNIVESAPGHQKRLRHDVVDNLRPNSAPRIGQNSAVMLAKQRLKARSPRERIIHTQTHCRQQPERDTPAARIGDP